MVGVLRLHIGHLYMLTGDEMGRLFYIYILSKRHRSRLLENFFQNTIASPLNDIIILSYFLESCYVAF